MQHSAYSCSRNAALRVYLYAYLGPIAELVRGQVDLAEAALPDQLSQRVVADALEVGGGEFTARSSVSMRMRSSSTPRRSGGLTREAACTRRRAACGRQSVKSVFRVRWVPPISVPHPRSPARIEAVLGPGNCARGHHHHY